MFSVALLFVVAPLSKRPGAGECSLRQLGSRAYDLEGCTSIRPANARSAATSSARGVNSTEPSARLGRAGLAALSRNLAHNTRVRKASLAGEDVGVAGAALLAEALRTNSALVYLNLYRSSIGDRGTESLASALASNSHLAMLDLWGNRIGDSGARALASSLRSQTSSLRWLYLAGNRIGDAGGRALASAVRDGGRVVHIEAHGNPMSAAVMRELLDGARRNLKAATWMLA